MSEHDDGNDDGFNEDLELETVNVWNVGNSKKIREEKRAITAIVDAEVSSEAKTSSIKSSIKSKFEELKLQRCKMSVNTKRRLEITDSKRKRKCQGVKSSGNNESKVKESDGPDWNEVKPYLNVNSHLHGPISHGDIGPKTELEQKIDDAIGDGDFELAEILSDHLANREFAVKITTAFNAKRYASEKEKTDEILKNKRKKKLYWGFEAKNRWEMKGNM